MQTTLPIYLDYMATTPMDPRVVEKMLRYFGPTDIFGNPASTTHIYGIEALKAVENARGQLAESLGSHPEAFVFTSGATEANNLAIIGAAMHYQRKGRHLITLQTEHISVLDTFAYLEKQGFEVTYLQPEETGLLSLQTLESALREDTILVSIMHVNNEIGVIQDIAAIGKLLRNKGIIFHVDAAQSAGKLPIDLSRLDVGLMSFSAHKNYGPKGIGALYICKSPRIRLMPLSFGGGQEQGVRSGTLPTQQIVGMGEAFSLSESFREAEQARLLMLKEKLLAAFKSISTIHVNGHVEKRIAGNLNISILGYDSQALLEKLHPLALSISSACAASQRKPSYVLKALGLSDRRIQSALRISWGRFTTNEEIDEVIRLIHLQFGGENNSSTLK